MQLDKQKRNIIRSVAVGLLMTPIVTWGMHKLEAKYTVHGTALFTSLRTVAGAIAPAVLVSVMTIASNAFGGADISIPGMVTAFLCVAVISAIQLAVVLLKVGRKGSAAYSE